MTKPKLSKDDRRRQLHGMTREQIIAEWLRVVRPHEDETLKKVLAMIGEILANEYPYE